MAVTHFKYVMGQELRERASAASAAIPPKLIVARRGYFEGQPAYNLNDANTGEFRGWFSEDMLEPYETPTAPPPVENPDSSSRGRS